MDMVDTSDGLQFSEPTVCRPRFDQDCRRDAIEKNSLALPLYFMRGAEVTERGTNYYPWGSFQPPCRLDEIRPPPDASLTPL